MFTFENRHYEDGEAVIQYLEGDMRVIKPGAYVRCAVTGTRIPVNDVKYWNVDKQEAYCSPKEVLKSLNLSLKNKNQEE